MFVFRNLFNKIGEKYGEGTRFALMCLPPLLMYILGLRPAMNNSSFFSHFVWVADCLVFGPPIGLFIAHRIGYGVGTTFGDAIFYPKRYLKTPPYIMSPIKGKIARREYDEAIEELNELLEGKPFSPEPYSILVEVYANELNDYSHAMELIEEYFNQEKVYCFDENIDMLLLYADICQEHNYLHKAQRLLVQEIKRKGYPELKRKRLETRLEAIAS
jgi:hypothetical protein